MMRLSWRSTFLAAWLFCLASTLYAVDVAEVRIQHVGPGTLDESSVLAHISLQVGSPYQPAAVARDVRALQQTGRFSLITTEVEPVRGENAVIVIYKVESKPRIRRMYITGADYLSNRKVRDLLELGIGDLVDDATLSVRARDVYEHYRKRYFVDPKLTWIIRVDPATGTADVTVTVKEGRRMAVRRIRFEGNKAISSRALRKSMKQKNWRPWARITKRNLYHPLDLETDVETIRWMYLNEGYLDVKVGQPKIRARKRFVNIIIPVEEGPLYRVGHVTMDGVSLFPEDTVFGAIRVRPGNVAAMSGVEDSRQALRDFYGSRGYIQTLTSYRLTPDLNAASVDVHFSVREGELAYFRDIRVRGNTRTKDKVIRRELTVYPGEIFDEVKVRRSENRLRNMGYFQMVRTYPEPTPTPHLYDLTFDVEEAKTGQLIAGAGFSSIDNVVGFVEIAQNNFDLFGWPHFTGGGQKVKLRTQIGAKRTDIDFSFVEPWFLNRQLEFSLDLFRSDKRFLSSDYDQRNIGGSVGLSRALFRHSRVRLSYSLEEIEIRNVSTNASQIIRDEEGRRTKSAVTLTLSRDTRDHFFIPSRGNRSSLSATLAGGALGGDTDLYLLEARSSQFVPLWFGHVFSLRGYAATVEEYGDSDRVPIFDRLFLGGARTIRGFRFRDVGPKDEFGEPIGGKTAAYLSAEYTIPVYTSIRLAGFYDIGMVWDDAFDVDTGDLNSAAGVGVRFDIPGFPLRFDYAWPLETDAFNDRKSGRFSFMIGYVF